MSLDNGELEPLTFMPTRELSPDELGQFVRYAGTIGLVPQFPYAEPTPITQDPSLSLSPRQELLQAYVRETYPKTRADYVGKEHFWVIGEELGVARNLSGRLFGELCFPMRGTVRSIWDSERLPAIDPSTLGLNVRDRRETSLASIPKGVLPPVYSSTREIAHKQQLGTRFDVHGAVLQISGMLGMPDQVPNLHELFMQSSYDAFLRFVSRFKLLPAPELREIDNIA
jgi:hypothetical protein